MKLSAEYAPLALCHAGKIIYLFRTLVRPFNRYFCATIKNSTLTLHAINSYLFVCIGMKIAVVFAVLAAFSMADAMLLFEPLSVQVVWRENFSTVFPRSLVHFSLVSRCIKWISWTCMLKLLNY